MAHGVLVKTKGSMKEMTKDSYQIGDTLEMLCGPCDIDQVHTVEAATKSGKITRVICNVCSSTSSFTRGVKSTVTVGTGRTASPYDRTRKYRRGQAMMHSMFGHGEVTAVFDQQKIDVAFGDRTRRLIHDQQ
jgi:hypothetical protein